MAHPKPKGATKNKDDGLENHKGLRGNQTLRPDDSQGPSSLGSHLVRLGEVAIYLICRNQHRDSKTLKKEGNVLQTEKQDESPATDLNETWTSNLLKIESSK